jgi:hypothetical protein
MGGRNVLGSFNFTNSQPAVPRAVSVGPGSNLSSTGPKLIFVQSNKPSLSNYTLTTGTIASIYNYSRMPGLGNYLQSAEQSNRMDLWSGSSLSSIKPQSSYSPGNCPQSVGCGSSCCNCEVDNPNQCSCAGLCWNSTFYECNQCT